jgi:hypothetical protein
MATKVDHEFYDDGQRLLGVLVYGSEPHVRLSEYTRVHAELARLRAQLDGLAEHFDNRAEELERGGCREESCAVMECAAHVRGIVKVEIGNG